MARGGKIGNRQYGKGRNWSKDKGSDDSDEDYTVGEDEEFEDSEEYCSSLEGEETEESLCEFEEEEEEEDNLRKVGRLNRRKGFPNRKKNGVGKAQKKRKVPHKEENDEDYGDEDYDYDYDGGVGEDDCEAFPNRKKNGVGKTQKKRRVPPRKEEHDEDYDYDDGDGEDDCDDFPNRKKNGVGKAQKKRRASRIEEYEEDYGDEDNDYDDGDGEDYCEGFPNRKKNRVGMAQKKRRVRRKEENDEDCEDDDYEYVGDGDEEDDDDYDNEYDDEDDEEFRPDEIDLDDEDELAVRKKNKKVGRPPSRVKGLVKGQKRKRSSKVMKKPMRKKLKKARGFQKKSSGGNDGAFTKMRSEKNSGIRKRRFMEDSDTDSISSGMPCFEYTISEEEREQVREASEFCKDWTISLRNSSSKDIMQGESCQQRKQIGMRGKEKAEDLKKAAGKQVCGICLSEEGKKTIRGTLNCCNHYYCFACILEWSKVESRCPYCKQRFVAISKPARSSSGLDLRTVVIQVPERDQIYQPSEEELRGYLDPYENVICTECQQGGDDALMLLCDLCDSPAHTYCVGLGHEVPDGNWYCDGCRPTALGFSNPQAPNPVPDHRTTSVLSGRSPTVENVREVIDLNVMPETPLPQGTGIFSSPRHLGGDFQAGGPLSGAGVLTVLERRRIQRQIHHLINNRMSEWGSRTIGASATTLGSNLLQSQIGRGREIAYQHARIPQNLMSDHAFPRGRLQDHFAPSAQSMNLFPERSSHSRGQLIQGQTSTSAGDSAHGMLQNGLPGISMGIDTRLGYEPLHPCNSRSSVGDANMSSYGYRETTVPSTFQGTLHAPF
ncbi:hypothetical protein NMG60_11032273 [Bertholletia excelsa]